MAIFLYNVLNYECLLFGDIINITQIIIINKFVHNDFLDWNLWTITICKSVCLFLICDEIFFLIKTRYAWALHKRRGV